MFIKKLGPGFITGAADDDPSGIATYSQTGAMFGYSHLWAALFTFPFMSAVQEMCGRIGLVTGNGLAGVIRKHYTKKILFVAVACLLVANTVNIGTDLGAMAAAAQLLLPIPFTVLLLGMTAVILLLEIFISYDKYVKILKYLTLSLFAYVIVVFTLRINWNDIIFATLIPTITLSRETILNIVALLGTTISPYLFFWQADQEAEEEIGSGKILGIGNGKPRVTKRDVARVRADTLVGMFFSNLIMFFIIATTAATLNTYGITNIETADQAAEVLRPLAGDFSFILFAIGIIGTGFLAVPILAGSAAYAIAESLGWRGSLFLKFKEAHGFYGIITIATLIGLTFNYIGIPPFTMLYYTAILNGIMAPPLILLILHISNNKKIMGKYTNSPLSNILGWIVGAVMMLCALALLVL
ncbi:divalent metal cation transporter [Candidatus Uhrbacteria bacterium]|nr:divalent metal cation transporter [Candidatus Uhrbacteria bacterium]